MYGVPYLVCVGENIFEFLLAVAINPYPANVENRVSSY
jgi:hypothetical protein